MGDNPLSFIRPSPNLARQLKVDPNGGGGGATPAALP